MTKAANQTALPPLSEHGASLSLLPPDPALRVTQAEFSRLVGVSRQTVSRWVKVGLIVPYPDGRFDPREAARRVIGHTDPSRLRAKVLRPLANDVHTLRTEIQAANARADEQRQRADAIQAELDASDKALDRLLDLVMEQRDAIGALVPGDDSEQWLQDLYGRALAETGYGPESAGFDPPGNQAPAADGRHG